MRKAPFQILALVAASFATHPTDSAAIADIQRRKAKLFEDDELTEDDQAHISAVCRAAEVTPPSEEARFAAHRLEEHLPELGEPEPAQDPDSEQRQQQTGGSADPADPPKA